MESNSEKYKVLDCGYVQLVDHMGCDDDLVATARVSYGKTHPFDNEEDNDRLMEFLISEGHESPLEQLVMKFIIKAPIFVERHYVRHRMASTNELSMRGKEHNIDYYIPTIERIMSDNTYGKNKSINHMDEVKANRIRFSISSSFDNQDDTYRSLIESGVPYELARIVLPVSAYTEKVWTVNLRSLVNILRQRTDKNAQWETQQYALALADVFQKTFPKIYRLVDNYIINGTTLSRSQVDFLKRLFNNTEKSCILEAAYNLTDKDNHKLYDIFGIERDKIIADIHYGRL